jgi:Tat protein secretion system quality control protein TatD with DNase activity
VNAESSDGNSLEDIINSLPPPVPLSKWLTKVDELLVAHPHSHLGEVGLDAYARLLSPTTHTPTKIQTSMEHQMAVLEKQIDLAAKYNRSISLHCVRSTGQFISLIQRKSEKQHVLPPRICIHSYSGSVDTIKLLTRSKKDKFPVDMYFSFSSLLNRRNRRFPDLVRAVPEDKLLVETDYHSPIGLDDLMQEIIEAVGEIKNWTPKETIERTRTNFMRFIGKD